MQKVVVLETKFYEGSRESLVTEVFASIEDEFSYLVTPNVNHACLLENDSKFREATELALIRVCDSRILAPFLRANGKPNVLEYPGSDLTLEVLTQANRRRLTVALVGGQYSDTCAVSRIFPDIVVKQYIPPMGFIDDVNEVAKIIAFFSQESFDLLIFAVGSPRGEILAMMLKKAKLRRGFGICSGAAISFISGRVPRAPPILRKLRLEWVYRIVVEPRRLSRRYLVDGFGFLKIFLAMFRKNSQ